jgi:hypothetical protein
MIAMSLAISKFRSCYWIFLPWIDSAGRHDRHELGDQQILGLVIGFYLGSTVIAMSLAISRFSA